MAINFYFFVHTATPLRTHRLSETESNYIQGSLDIPVSEEGKKEAEKYVKKVKDIPFSAIYSSDLSRCIVIAEILAKELQRPVIISQELRGRTWNQFEGMSIGDILKKYPFYRRTVKIGKKSIVRLSDDFFTDFGIENYSEGGKRITAFLSKLSAKHEGESIGIVTHGFITFSLLLYLGYSREDLYYIQSPFKITLENGKYGKVEML